MKRKSLLSIVFALAMAVACLFGAVACDKNEESHKHTFANTYSYDATHHWKNVTCEHTDQIRKRPHDLDANGACTVCDYDPSNPDNNPGGGNQDIPDDAVYRAVSFDVSGGDGTIGNMDFAVGHLMVNLPTPTRSGYTFVCWIDYYTGEEYTAATVMPDKELHLTAQWERVITSYEDDYISLRPASQGVKSWEIEYQYAGEVDQFVYVEIKSSDLGGRDYVGTTNNFTLRTLDGMNYNVKQGYTWTWYQGSFSSPNGAQRFTLNYGSNLQFVTVMDASGVVQQIYLLDIFVLRDYAVNLYENVYETEPYNTVYVTENERFAASTDHYDDPNFDYESRVYYNVDTMRYENFVYSTAITKDWNLYQRYAAHEFENVTLNGGTLAEGATLAARPYEPFFTLPSPEKSGYDFIGWKDQSGKYVTGIEGHSGVKYISTDYLPTSLTAEFAQKRAYHQLDEDGLLVFETVPVATYTDEKMTDVLEIIYVPATANCAPPALVPQKAGHVFKRWMHYPVNDGVVNTTAETFTFTNTVTAPAALVPYMEEVSDDYSDYTLLAYNVEKSYSTSYDFVVYLPVSGNYTITATGDVSIYRNSTSYADVDGVATSNINASSAGYVTFRVNNNGSNYTVRVTGPGSAYSTSYAVTTAENLANIGSQLSVNAVAPGAGYTFVGWKLDDTVVSTEQDYSLTVPSDFGENGWLTYIPEWTQYTVTASSDFGGSVALEGSSYAISFNLNGVSGTAPQTQIIDVNNALVFPTIPTHSEYLFAGWYENPECEGDAFDFSATVTANKTLYAKWVTHSANAGAFTSNYTCSVVVNSRNNSSKTYFAYAAPADGTIIVYSSSSWDTYCYLLDSNKTQLTYDDDGGDSTNFRISYNVTAGNVYYIVPCGYSSSGTLQLHFSAVTPAAGGTIASGAEALDEPLPVTAGEEVTLVATSDDESVYAFLGWYDGEEQVCETETFTFTMPARNVNYVAKWDYRTVTVSATQGHGYVRMSSTENFQLATRVSFDLNGATGNAPATQFFGGGNDTLVYPEIPTREGYLFGGWYTEPECTNLFNFSSSVTTNTTLYAKWVAYDGAGVIAINGSIEIEDAPSKDSSGDRVYYAFVPLVSGYVTIYSTDNSGDTYGFLYNSDKSSILQSNDDGGDSTNFRISYNVTAGTLYYVAPCSYSGNGTDMTVCVEGTATPAAGGSGSGAVVNTNESVSITDQRFTIVGLDADVTLTANVNSGYTFTGWYENGELISTEASITFSASEGSRNITMGTVESL